MPTNDTPLPDELAAKSPYNHGASHHSAWVKGAMAALGYTEADRDAALDEAAALWLEIEELRMHAIGEGGYGHVASESSRHWICTPTQDCYRPIGDRGRELLEAQRAGKERE